MKITPLEIKRQQFKKVMRGFDPVEVETFLEMVSNDTADLTGLLSKDPSASTTRAIVTHASHIIGWCDLVCDAH